MKPLVSIIILNYHVKDELFACIESIYNSKTKASFEIIVVDNDEIKTIKKDLLKRYPHLIYIANKNKGFGQGNNIGAKSARGEYLFILNPDTIVFKGVIDTLIQFLKTNKKAGVVAPFLLHENKKPFKQQGVKVLTPFRAVFALSFINKLFPNNPVAKNYFIQWNKIETKEVDVVPGTAFMISAELYNSLKGFDENFFLYFEEFDLCKRIKDKGYLLFIEPEAKIIHLWERSTRQRNDIKKIFSESRYYYFKKHFGTGQAILTNTVLTFGKYSFYNFLILILAAFLLFYRLNELMQFIGDQGWFYLSARDMLLTGKIPLVGITSSHTWLHQGPLWTYLLALSLLIGNFNPLAGAYFTAIIGLFTVWLVYKVGSAIFSARVGIIASLFYATSPLIIFNARMPFHTSLIPTFTLLWFYTLYKWINGFKYGFPVLLFLLALLYNLELAMIMLVPILAIILIYGIVNKTKWLKGLLNYKIIALSLLCLVIPMIPMLIYDVHHGYPQTIKFGIWILYKIANFIHIPLKHPDIPGETYQSMIAFASISISRLFPSPNVLFGWIILSILSINLFIVNVIQFSKKNYIQSYSLLLLLFLVPFLIYIAEKTNSEAYWPVFFTTIAFMYGLLFNTLLSVKRYFYFFAGLLVLLIGINIWSSIRSDDLNGDISVTFSNRIVAAKKIIHDTSGKEYNLYGRGSGSQFASFTMNYQYLTWWLGHGPSLTKQKIQIYVTDLPPKIIIQKRELK
jgi:GT2 family glycosyltransferase/4-amino-4-deoxy-L-arabinose transferase-like glycosyltransferase